MFSENQIVNILKEAKAGVSLEELIRQHGFSTASFYIIGKQSISGASTAHLVKV